MIREMGWSLSRPSMSKRGAIELRDMVVRLFFFLKENEERRKRSLKEKVKGNCLYSAENVVSALSGRGVCAEHTIRIVMSWGRSMAVSAVIVTAILHEMLGRFTTITFETGVGSDLSMNEGRWYLSWRRYFMDWIVASEFCYFLVKSFNR